MECTMKLFDVASFDVIHIIKLSFIPSVCEFVHKTSSFSPLLAIAEFNTTQITIIKAEQPISNQEKSQADSVLKNLNLHESPVRLIKFNAAFNLVISTD